VRRRRVRAPHNPLFWREAAEAFVPLKATGIILNPASGKST